MTNNKKSETPFYLFFSLGSYHPKGSIAQIVRARFEQFDKK